MDFGFWILDFGFWITYILHSTMNPPQSTCRGAPRGYPKIEELVILIVQDRILAINLGTRSTCRGAPRGYPRVEELVILASAKSNPRD